MAAAMEKERGGPEPSAPGGLVYVCNPNNPTATLTPPADLRALLERLPEAVTVLVDEAYHHYADGLPGYASAAPLLARHANLVIARTFSKVYGMAGLRCGYALARPGRIQQLRALRPWDSINLMAIVAARAGLADAAHVERSRALNAEQRRWTTVALERAGCQVLPSAANFVMADTHRDVGPLIAALKTAGVEVGRRFATLPTHLRVTLGTQEDMLAFATAFTNVAKT
jgi:histidinol-phosphate aminotransferase